MGVRVRPLNKLETEEKNKEAFKKVGEALQTLVDPVRRARTPVEIEQISGALALRALRESVYRMRFANAIIGREKLFRTLGALISAVRVQTFDRSLLKSEFENSTAVMRDWILDHDPAAR